MPTTYKFVSLVMCDDCRREDNGREILIGTYAGGIASTVVPFILPTFALRFEIIPMQKEYRKMVATMKNPKDEDVFRAEGIGLQIERPQFPASFFFKVSPLMIAMTGEYKVFLGMDEEPEQVATLTIIQADAPLLVPPQVS